MGDEVASESTWRPIQGSDRLMSGSEDDLREGLLGARESVGGLPYHASYESSPERDRPRRRSSINNEYQPFRTPFRTRL